MYRYFQIMASLVFWAPDVSGATTVLFHNKNVFPAYAGIQKHLIKRGVNVATKPKVFLNVSLLSNHGFVEIFGF
jgi:hypothetical protein